MNDHIGKPLDTNTLMEKLDVYLGGKDPRLVSVPDPLGYSAQRPIINVSDGLARMMKNKELYMKLLTDFVNSRTPEELIECVVSGDFANSARIAHTLRGGAANLGLDRLADIVSAVEAQAKANLESGNMLPALREALEDTRNAIRTLLEDEENSFVMK
jgi:HPt (histidine-containing phosphotransfer) domain-containing protein